MSDKFVPYHLRDINNPPAHLDDKQTSNWIPLNLAASSYEIVYVNKFTTTEIMQKLIDHVRHCHEFIFDTEGDRSSKQLALIQIQTIPRQLPCFVVLLELLHLPSHDILIFVKIRQLFRLIFQSNNKLYSWGPLRLELYPAVNYELFEWAIKSQIFDIQRNFSKWYIWALCHCEVCSPSLLQRNVINDVHSNPNINSSSTCTYYEASLYGPGEKRRLQDALIYTCQSFIDKSMTASSSPSPSLSSSHHENNDIINTNINPQLFKNVIDHDLEFISEDSDDVITINQCRTIPVNNALYEQISDDEICISQLIGPITTKQPELEDISDDEQQQHQPSIAQHLSHDRRIDERRCRRSDAARRQRNRKRNYIHRLHRCRHILVRRIYHRFTMSSVKDIRRQHHIHYRHIKIVASSLIIGINNSTLQHEFNQSLPKDSFDREHYYYRRRQHYHHHQHH
ncbi:unnamed protein product [Rotaria magnacalcarata]|uniref:Uncharacterized protein n=3 Tax=Rotaria magnacalcarata TaxID=392030 RepID=A0A815KNW1_9BILA|nr:unnamed protein product [Rotaria magnacalcarata]